MSEVLISKLDPARTSLDVRHDISCNDALRSSGELHVLPHENLPPDAFSPSYRNVLLNLHRNIGRERSELHSGDTNTLATPIHRSFPYNTSNLKLAAAHFGQLAAWLKHLDLDKRSDVLQFSHGAGEDALALARCGHKVTVVDLADSSGQEVRRHAQKWDIDTIETITGDYLWPETTKRRFDTIIFFKAFHRCWEFERLLRSLHRILRPGGSVYFAAEPISRDASHPWFMQLDAEALNAGSLQLCFQSEFFGELLTRTDWVGACVEPGFWIARARRDPIIIRASDSRLKSQAGTIVDGALRVTAPGGSNSSVVALHGPYLTLPAGRYIFEVRGVFADPGLAASCTLDAVRDGGVSLYSRPCRPSEFESGALYGGFQRHEEIRDLEVRLHVPGGFRGSIEQIWIRIVD